MMQIKELFFFFFFFFLWMGKIMDWYVKTAADKPFEKHFPYSSEKIVVKSIFISVLLFGNNSF